MPFTLFPIADGDVAGVAAVFLLQPLIAHERLATGGAGMLHLAFTVEQISMGIPPCHTAMIRTEAPLSMPKTYRKFPATLVACAVADGVNLPNAGRMTDIAQTEGLDRVAR